ncbi:surfeit locus protein 1 [Diorhabda sublineata]|uniref:surfeit locus protein 1 n=1 Tax=Diorhabda sublineata TaxID=1163346 RepID=UPI0024E101A6|nr:surfeit locus protein 1 [Diorhabda sublineata]
MFLKILQHSKLLNLKQSVTRHYCTHTRKIKSVDVKKIGPFGWFLLVIPATTFSLGVWQMQRKKWKEQLIADLQERTASHPVKLPEDLDNLKDLEYKAIHVRGEFLHDKELYIGPRSVLVKGDASTKSSLVSGSANTTQGYLVVTPFKLENRDDTILINRGWVPNKLKDPKTRQEGQVNGVVDVIGILRTHEPRPNFTMKNREGSNIYFYRDLNHMTAVTGASPIFLDATNDFDIPNGPIGGQTRISLRNEHLSYILTWFSLCGATSFMWYKKFIK